MIHLLDINDFCKKLKPVSNTVLFTREGKFHDEGLFSELIFGPENSSERKKTYSYIDLNCEVIHPAAYRILIQLDRKIEKYLSTEVSYSLDSEGKLIPDPENGLAGLRNFKDIFMDINFRGETEKRDSYIDILKGYYKKGLLFISKIIVLPSELRPAFQDESGMWTIDNLNQYYTEILRKSFQIKGTGKGVLYDLLNFNVQKSILKHDDYLRSKIAKKSGLIRQQLLGKRVEFSGRAVITPGPELTSEEVGLPFRMAVVLFEPFIIRDLLYTLRVDREVLRSEIRNYLDTDISIDSIKQILKAIKNNDKIPESLYKLIWESTEISMRGRVVLLKRDPVLHSLGIRAFFPKLIDGGVIRLSTMAIGGFNADFDGDQMGVFHPLSNEAQKEAREKMMRLYGGASSTTVSYEISKEMYLGLYSITKDVKLTGSPISITKDDLENSTDPFKYVLFRGQKTSMGKAIFNNCFPVDFKFIDEVANSSFVKKLLDEVLKKYPENVYKEVLNRLKNTGFKFATIFGTSILLDTFDIPDEIYKLRSKLEKATPSEVGDLLGQMEKILIEKMKGTGFYDLMESGAGKGWNQAMAMLVAKGIVADSEGNLMPVIANSLADGMTNTQYFNAAYGARYGIVNRVINTADTGYFARKLAYVLNSIEIHPTLKDCKTQRTLSYKLTKKTMKNFEGRYIVKGGKIELFDSSNFKDGDVINLRSPIYCQSPKICNTCYGKLIERHKSRFIGVVAAQSIGERGTQMIMKAFHDTSVKVVKRDVLGDIVSNNSIEGFVK